MTGPILITPRSITREGHLALERLRAAGHTLRMSPAGRLPTEEELHELLPGCVGYLAGVEIVSKSVLVAAKELRVIARNGAGINSIDLEAAQQLGIEVMPAVGANAQGVAELTIALILSLVRSLPKADFNLKQHRWERDKGIELSGRTLGLVGCGAIGQRVAHIAMSFGMNVIGYDPYSDKSRDGSDLRYVELDEIFAASDVISLHCPPTENGRPIVCSAKLEMMRDGALLINAARAELLDDQAVLAALNSNKLAGLAIDVFHHEPPGDNSLVHHPRVIATPHLGGYTVESIDRAVNAAVENLLTKLSEAK